MGSLYKFSRDPRIKVFNGHQKYRLQTARAYNSARFVTKATQLTKYVAMATTPWLSPFYLFQDVF